MNFREKHEKFVQEVVSKIKELIENVGVESKHHSNKKVLKIGDEQAFNLEGGRYLSEISETELIDNYGYLYGLHVLDLEQLCEAVDSFDTE